MSEKTGVAIQSMKAAQTEMVQWENRIEAIKQTYGNLQRQAEILQATMDQKRSDFENYISTREKQVREAMDKVSQDRLILDTQREEFKGILAVHEKDKMNLIQEKQQYERDKSAFSGRQQLINDFIQAVRRAYNVLPES
jgi:hypothetical protein